MHTYSKNDASYKITVQGRANCLNRGSLDGSLATWENYGISPAIYHWDRPPWWQTWHQDGDSLCRLRRRTCEWPLKLEIGKFQIYNILCFQINITFDWDMSPVNYTCYNPSHLFIPNQDLPALLETETVPEGYVVSFH